MKPDQKYIYYFASDSKKSAQTAPFLEQVKEKGFEVRPRACQGLRVHCVGGCAIKLSNSLLVCCLSSKALLLLLFVYRAGSDLGACQTCNFLDELVGNALLT
jgi:hypothetical protein